jgi:hypothetical protein
MPSLGARVREAIRRRPYTILLTAVLTALAVPFCLRSGTDWDGVYLAAARRLTAGESIFHDGYLYPPVSAWLALPFSKLPHVPSRLAWYTVNVVALLVVLTGSWHLSGGGRLQGQPPVARREHLILGLGLLTSIYYVLDALSNQQTDLVLAGLLVGGCLLLVHSRALLAAVLFGIAAGIKCTPLLWSPYLAWRRRWAAAGTVLAVAIGINLLPDLTHLPAEGVGRLQQWVSVYLRPLAGSDHDPGVWASAINFNHSVAGVCNRWLTAERVWGGDDFKIATRPNRISARLLKVIVYSLCLTLVLIAVRTSRRRVGHHGDGGEYGLVLILMLMLSPMSSKPHFCTLLLPGFWLARAAVERRDLLPRLLLAGAILAGLLSNKDLVGRFAYDTAIWYGSVFWNTVLLFAGCVVVLRPHEQAVTVMEHQRQAA